MTALKVPTFGESITEGTLVRWLKEAGMSVKDGEPLVEIETDKVTVEVPSPMAGVLQQTMKKVGDKVLVGEVLGEVVAGDGKVTAPNAQEPKAAKKDEAAAKVEPARVAANDAPAAMPAARRLAEESGVDTAQISGTGRGGRILKEDVQAAQARAPQQPAAAQVAVAQSAAPKLAAVPNRAPSAPRQAGERERRVTMSPLRKRVGERLLQAQSNAAILTTFNEVDMAQIMALRKRHQDTFVAKHGIKLGFMSFFVKAVVEALRTYPSVGAEISGDDIIYKDYYDIGVAVGGGKGLVVPVVRDADRLGYAELEKTISDFGARAKANKLTLEDLSGGTFTISNGGVYGSLLSTPILNPPQSGILGMHNIQDRPVVRDGQVVVRPMMYLALSYDHRLVDGREAVLFLIRVKECIEDPERLLLEV